MGAYLALESVLRQLTQWFWARRTEQYRRHQMEAALRRYVRRIGEFAER